MDHENGCASFRMSRREVLRLGGACALALTLPDLLRAHPPATESRGDFPPSPSDFPPFGAVLSQTRPSAGLPTWVQIGPLMRRNNGTVLHGQIPGFLGVRNSPFAVDQDLLPAEVCIDA